MNFPVEICALLINYLPFDVRPFNTSLETTRYNDIVVVENDTNTLFLTRITWHLDVTLVDWLNDDTALMHICIQQKRTSNSDSYYLVHTTVSQNDSVVWYRCDEEPFQPVCPWQLFSHNWELVLTALIGEYCCIVYRSGVLNKT